VERTPGPPGDEPDRLDGMTSGRLRPDVFLAIFLAIVGLALLTRFVGLGTRVMSHDETTHVYFSWLLEQGRGYSHDPLSHGPLQFHLLALSYFLFGDNDASARIPAAICGVLAVVLIWPFRRWLGRLTAVVTSALIFASPFLLYYARYARNEAFVVVEALLMFWAVFAYLERRKASALYLLAAALSLQYVTKETAFIYTAQLLIFLAILFFWEVLRHPWASTSRRTLFLIGTAVMTIGAAMAIMLFLAARTAAKDSATLTVSPIVGMGALLAVAGLVLAGIALVRNFGRRLRTDFPALDLLIITGTLALTQLGALPAAAMGWDPLAYSDTAEWSRTLVMVVGVIGVAAAIGILWDWKRWLIAGGVFAVIYVPLYTTLFTNPQGLATGLVGSLGYWLVQQGVQRGTQPLYYYLLIQIPVYEYLVAIGGIVAAGMGIAALIRGGSGPGSGEAPEGYDIGSLYPIFFGYWSATAIVLYTFAGERMPWLTVHIALPLILLAGWAFGRFLSKVDWSRFRQARTWAVVGLITLAVLSFVRFLGYLGGSPPPFAGTDLDHLRATNGLLTTLLFGIVSTYGAVRLATGWTLKELGRLAGVVALGGLYLLTLRTSFRAAFVNYDDATEYLVYAHSAGGPKLALTQIEELSRRTTGGLDIDVGYDNETTYPFWWYLRNYPNAHYFGENPSRDLLDYPVVLAGQGHYQEVEAILRNRYYEFEYNRVWWPMQDYFDLTAERVRNALTSPEWRAALWDVWFNRDYSKYGQLTQRDFSLRNWSPAEKFKLYVRKDVATQVWDYGVAPAVLEPISVTDPYAEKTVVLSADASLGTSGTGPDQLSNPRDLEVAKDGSLYIADTGNNRILHWAADGSLLNAWGEAGNLETGPAPGGAFNEPWGLAIAPNGTIYVADTWNHRIQHFTADGRFMGMWGTFGQAESQTALWGPRDVEVDAAGRVYVADTGNKRIVVFTPDGEPLGQIGEPGGGPLEGQLDEPVGIAIGPDGLVYVADTWNSRIQVFQETSTNTWEPVREWTLDAWLTNSLDNKPYLAAASDGRVCASDPEGYRVLCFTSTGDFLVGWGSPGSDPTQFGLPAGVAFESQCNVWVSDTRNSRIERFTLPGCP
jgi:uncharacterized protein (TIGR03663 family)